MENKAKKILAGVGLGLVGMSCLTGCSLTDSQQKALDLLTEKSDEIISLLEENLELTNSQLSKADAIELLGLARTKLSLGKYNELLMKTTSAAYEGFFEKKIGYAQSNAPYVYYKKTNDMIYTALCDFDSSLSILQTANFVNNEAYTYNAKSDEKQENTYTSGMFDMGILLNSFVYYWNTIFRRNIFSCFNKVLCISANLIINLCTSLINITINTTKQ